MINETTLTYQVYVAPIIAMAGKDVPPGQSRSTWSPISATLISGRHDAVLVDPLMTVEQGMAVADRARATTRSSPCLRGSGASARGQAQMFLMFQLRRLDELYGGAAESALTS